MSYYNLEQALEVFKKELPQPMLPFDLPQLAALCRQGCITILFPYARYAAEVIENEHLGGKHTEWQTTSFYDDYFTHERLLSLLDKSTDKLELFNAMAYARNGKMYEVALLANPIDTYRYSHDDNYSVSSDDDLYTITRESLLFPSDQVQSYIALQHFDDLTTPEQQRIAELESELAALKEQLSQQANTPANADPLQGIAKYNADKAYIITTGKALASYLWSMDSTQAIRTGDMVQQVRQVMHNIDPSMLPDDKTIRGWLSSIAPNYAKKGGKPSNHAPNEIPLIMKK